jgi:hypothetical protein
MPRHLRPFIAALVALLFLAAACGADDGAGQATNLDPDEAILAAFTELDATLMEVTFALDATADEILSAMEADGTDPDDRAMAELLTQARVRVVGAGDDMAVEVLVGTDSMVEMRVVDRVAYLRVDVDAGREVMERIQPGSGAEVDEVLSMLPLLTAGDPRLGFIGDLVGGSWLSLEVPDDSDYAHLWDTGSDPTQLDDELTAVVEAILDENTVITADGTARGGDRYLVQVEVARILTAFSTNPLTAEAFGLVGTDPDQVLGDMLDEGVAPTWELDVVLVDGRLSSIRVDLAALSTDAPAGATLPVLISFAGSPTAPSAPTDHTPIPSALIEEMMGDLMSDMLGGMGDLRPTKA